MKLARPYERLDHHTRKTSAMGLGSPYVIALGTIDADRAEERDPSRSATNSATVFLPIPRAMLTMADTTSWFMGLEARPRMKSPSILR